MRIPTSRGRRIALVATIAGAVLVLVGGYLTLFNSSSESGTADSSSLSNPFVPFAGAVPESIEDPIDPAQTGENDVAGVNRGVGDPFAAKSGDNRFYTVRITVQSDGDMYIGYRYRDGRGDIKLAQQTFTKTTRVRGPRPLAQVGVQVRGTGTYATCTIAIDGVTVSRATAPALYHVTVCTG